MAIPTVAAFRLRYPEFGATAAQGASDVLIQAALDDAAAICDECVYGDRHTQAIMFHAADDLARSPFARNMQLVDKSGETSYQGRAKQLMRIAAAGIRNF